MKLTDQDIRELLKELDESDHRVTRFEADYIENTVFKYPGKLSPKQRETALKMLRKYDIL